MSWLQIKDIDCHEVLIDVENTSEAVDRREWKKLSLGKIGFAGFGLARDCP